MFNTIDIKKKNNIMKSPVPKQNAFTKKETKMEEEIDLNKNLIKENVININEPKKIDEKINESDDDYEEIKKDNGKDDKKTYNLSNDDEKEIIRINLKKNIVIRILDINDEKFIDFCKFYKGYPTKKNIRIKYKTYLKIKDLLILN